MLFNLIYNLPISNLFITSFLLHGKHFLIFNVLNLFLLILKKYILYFSISLVILCPFGLTGKLTGNGYKYSDPNMARFLNEWNNFFPHHWKRDQWKMDGEYPHVVEVLTCKLKLCHQKPVFEHCISKYIYVVN